jgi:glyoxylase-like metal-dependent hydrolase (beta-lactamase superfamily II)
MDCYETDGPCDNLPIPPSAFGFPNDPAKGYYVENLRPGVYAVTAGAYFFLVALSEMGSSRRRKLGGKKGGKKGSKNKVGYEVAIIDFPEGNFVVRDQTGQIAGSLVTTAIDEIVFEMNGLAATDIGKVQMVYSHAHFDHIGAATITYEHIMSTWDGGDLDIDIIAHEGVLEEFEERIEANFFSYRAPLPTHTVDEVTAIEVGDNLVYTLTPAAGHSDAKDLVVFFEADGENDYPAVMMFVDVVFPGWAPFFSFALSTDLFAFLKVHEMLLDEFDLGDTDIFVGGHLNKLGTKADIQLSYDFTKAVMDAALLALNTVDIGPIAGASGAFDPSSANFGNSWFLFAEYFKVVNKFCAKLVVAEFGCVLAGVDIVAETHCNIAQDFFRIDF